MSDNTRLSGKRADLEKISTFVEGHSQTYNNILDNQVYGVKLPITVMEQQWFLIGESKQSVVLSYLNQSIVASSSLLLLCAFAALVLSTLVAKKFTLPINRLLTFSNKYSPKKPLEIHNKNELVYLENVIKDMIVSRVEYQNTLENYQSRMETACDAADIVMFEIDLHNQHLTWDERGYTLFHIQPNHEDKLFELWINSIYELDRPKVQAIFERCLKNKLDIDIEYKLSRNNNISIRTKASYQATGKETGFWLGIHTDISEVKKTEIELRESQAFQNTLLQNIPDIFFVKDADFKIVNANSAFLNLYPEEARDKVIGFTTLESYSVEEREEFLKEDRKVLTNGYSETEESILFPDGHRRVLFTKKARFYNQEGRPHILGLARDITHIKDQQEALFFSSERYRLAMEVSDSGIWDWDLESNSVYLSEQLRHWLLLPRNESVHSLVELLHPFLDADDLPLLQSTLSPPFEEGAIKLEIKLTVNRSPRHFILSARQLKNIQGETIKLIGNLSDVTSLKEQQLLLEEAKINAETTSALKSGFLATISHEVRTPLNGILGTLTLLNKQVLDEQSQFYISQCTHSANYLQKLLNEVLDFSKLEQQKLDLNHQEFDLVKLIEGVSHSHQPHIESKSLTLSIDDRRVNKALYIGDAHRVEQILHNLLQNAIKFTEKGAVEIILNIKEHLQGALFICHVRDTGCGMKPQQLSQIFGEFSQLDNSSTKTNDGVGLGLSIVNKLIALMGGKIKVRSKLGVGSVFTFSLPLSIAPRQSELSTHKLPHCIIVAPHNKHTEVSTALLECMFEHVTHYPSLESFLETDKTSLLNVPTLLDESLLRGADLDELNQCADRKISLIGSEFSHLSFIDKFLPKPITLNKLRHFYFASFQDSLENKKSQEMVSHGNHQVIAIAEDNPLNQLIVTKVIESNGYKCFVANNGEELIKALKKHDNVSLILMDCQMPILDGYQATKKIRKGEAGNQYAQTPIIALTANAMAGDEQKCLSAGMNGFLAKPYTETELLEKISQALRKELANNVVRINDG